MPAQTYQQWFCLAAGRKNFEIDPASDHTFLFGEKKWQEEILSRLQMAQALGLPPRLIWWGQYGIGKTHRLRHTQYLIDKQSYPYLARYVVATDIYETSGFDRLHYELVNALGRQELRSMVSSYLLKQRNQETGVPPIEEICGAAPDVQAALRSFGGLDTPQLELPAWRFLCGLRLKTNEVELANVTKEALGTSVEYAATLRALASIVEIESGKRVLYLIDECEHLTKITNRITVARWQEALRALLDIRNLGIVMTVGAERMEALPTVVLLPDIVRRIQRDNYVHMEALKTRAVKSFLRGVLAEWIDSDLVRDATADRKLDGEDDYDPKLFPFTRAGFDAFCEWSVADPRNAKPSEILDRLNRVTFNAYQGDQSLLTADFLRRQGALEPKKAKAAQ